MTEAEIFVQEPGTVENETALIEAEGADDNNVKKGLRVGDYWFHRIKGTLDVNVISHKTGTIVYKFRLGAKLDAKEIIGCYQDVVRRLESELIVN